MNATSQGEFDVTCWFGGMCILPWCPGVRIPDSTIVIAAPGYKQQPVRLLSNQSDAHVARRRCDSETLRNCYQIDVVLERDDGGPNE